MGCYCFASSCSSTSATSITSTVAGESLFIDPCSSNSSEGFSCLSFGFTSSSFFIVVRIIDLATSYFGYPCPLVATKTLRSN